MTARMTAKSAVTLCPHRVSLHISGWRDIRHFIPSTRPVTNLSVVSVPGSRAVYLGRPLIPHIMSLPVPISVLRSPSSVLRPPSSESFRPSLIMLRGGLPRAVCCCRRHSVGWYGLNADRFSSGQSPEFTGLLSGNSSAATLTGLATEGPANIA